MPKVILISGGSDGLGKAIAQTLSSNNQVVILAHNKTKLEAAAKEIGSDFVEADVSDYGSVQTAITQVIAKYQKIDVLINNAGVWTEGFLESNDPAKIKEIIDVNTLGTIFLTKAVLPQMKLQKSGQIINIISQDGLCAKKERTVYTASKWAITGFTKCLQEDLVDENIKVTGVYPGLMKTALFQKDQVQRDLTNALEPTAVATFIEYVVNLNQSIDIPEIVIKNKTSQTKTMDDTSAPVIDLNIDPDLITPQGSSPQAALPSQPSQPTVAPVTTPGVIDITPGADTPAPLSPSAPLTPSAPITTNTPSETSHLADLSLPQAPETPAPVVPLTTSIPEVLVTPITPEVSVTPDLSAPLAAVPSSLPPQVQNITPSPEAVAPVSSSTPSPIAEDPDLVKLVK